MRIFRIVTMATVGIGLGLGGAALAQPAEPPVTDPTGAQAAERGQDNRDVGDGVRGQAESLRDVEGPRDEAAQSLRRRALEDNEGFRRGLEESGGEAGAALERSRPADAGAPIGPGPDGRFGPPAGIGKPDGFGPPRGILGPRGLEGLERRDGLGARRGIGRPDRLGPPRGPGKRRGPPRR